MRLWPDLSPTVSKISKKKKKKNNAETATTTPSQPTKASKLVPKPQELPDKSLFESRHDMHQRLAYGVKVDLDRVDGVMIAGTLENPHMQNRTRTFTEFEVQRLTTW